MSTSSNIPLVIKDIEDLMLSHNVNFKEKYQLGQNKIMREKKRKKQVVFPELQIYCSVIPGTQSIYIRTWGCAHNNSDSEYIAGQLATHGYSLCEDKFMADLWILNSCTVKNPAEDHFRNEIETGRKFGKHIVVAGCIPQGAPNSNFIKGLSIMGVHQIDRVLEVVEETLKGNVVRFLSKKKESGRRMGGASLHLPKVRKNPHIEIIAINTGCLNHCTYCKTKHARGELGSYKPEEIVTRAVQAFEEGVSELWLTSEDTGAYGKDIGTSLPELLLKLVDVIPDGCRMRIGMTNPPYIMDYLDEMGEILKHPKIYKFLHIPVQSGSDQVLADMKREYTRYDFEHLVDFLKKCIPDITIATDIICGFPTETDKDFEDTMSLCQKYRFPSLFINQFFPRPGTPAAKMTQISTKVVKKRTKILSEFFQSYQPYNHKIGELQDVLVTEIAHDKKHYVAHNLYYEQVLIPMQQKFLGKVVTVKIISASKHCMRGLPFNQDIPTSLRLHFEKDLIHEISKNIKLQKLYIYLPIAYCAKFPAFHALRVFLRNYPPKKNSDASDSIVTNEKAEKAECNCCFPAMKLYGVIDVFSFVLSTASIILTELTTYVYE